MNIFNEFFCDADWLAVISDWIPVFRETAEVTADVEKALDEKEMGKVVPVSDGGSGDGLDDSVTPGDITADSIKVHLTLVFHTPLPIPVPFHFSLPYLFLSLSFSITLSSSILWIVILMFQGDYRFRIEIWLHFFSLLF